LKTSRKAALTGRQSRNDIVCPPVNANAQNVADFLDGLEMNIGIAASRKIFITLTCDGSGKFMDIEGLERSCTDGKTNAQLYFLLPFAAYGRTTNEVHNRMLRQFFSKVVPLRASQTVA